MQNEDRRIVFAIPYLDRYTMIGTTDREYHGDPAQVSITEQEIAYVLWCGQYALSQAAGTQGHRAYLRRRSPLVR